MPQSPDGQPNVAQERAEYIRKHLEMAHLKEGKAEAMAAVRRPDAAPTVADDPKMQLRYAFDVKWEDARGHRYEGRFVTKILSIQERKAVGAMRARQMGNAPVESLAVDAFLLAYWTCWMELSLVERPDWFKDIDSLVEPDLVQAVFEEVSAHDSTFHGHKKPAPAGD